VLGAASAGPDRPKIGMLVHPKMVLQDLVGPLTVFNLAHAEIHLVWKTLDPVPGETGLAVNPTTRLSDCPEPLDVLFVPGGLDCTIALMDDRETVGFLRERGEKARYITSVCTGALLLGAAGLLRGYRATGHWYIRDLLGLMGATPVHERVVVDRNRITGGGVTARIDFGLTLVSLLRTQSDAEWAQLIIEYDPVPPRPPQSQFTIGSWLYAARPSSPRERRRHRSVQRYDFGVVPELGAIKERAGASVLAPPSARPYEPGDCHDNRSWPVAEWRARLAG